MCVLCRICGNSVWLLTRRKVGSGAARKSFPVSGEESDPGAEQQWFTQRFKSKKLQLPICGSDVRWERRSVLLFLHEEKGGSERGE